MKPKDWHDALAGIYSECFAALQTWCTGNSYRLEEVNRILHPEVDGDEVAMFWIYSTLLIERPTGDPRFIKLKVMVVPAGLLEGTSSSELDSSANVVFETFLTDSPAPEPGLMFMIFTDEVPRRFIARLKEKRNLICGRDYQCVTPGGVLRAKGA